MNRLIASLLIVTIAGVFAKISPSSQADISIADFADLQQLDALVNSDFGVISGTSPQGLKLGSFSIGSDFELNSVAYIDAYCTGASQLINAGDNVDEFLLFCSSNSSVVFLTIDINDSNGNMTVTNSSEYDPNGVAMISASAFVTKQGNVYMSDSSDGMISIVEFHVADGTFVTRFENILEDYEGDWYIQDLHSLPYDAGVSVILNSNDNSTQMFLSCYFNGTTFDNTIPEGQVLQYVGRHRGSNFGYTIGVQSPYTIVTAWDLSDRSISNSVQIKGELLQRNDGHFSTNEMVFVYSEADGSGYIYELPYSERGFLPNSVNFEEVDAFGDGNLADGQDGTHIYSFTASDSGDAQLSRWLF